MSHSENLLKISQLLIEWYQNNKRDLPWRETTDPYIIWISEIILQQTRVAQGYDYFLRFTKRFPTIDSLAAAEEDEVLKYWQGLGYYSRARNLHATAKTIQQKYNGIFPSDHKEVLALKGIGEYTAAAIVSFAWNQSYPVVDGNVFRVLSRLFALDTPIDSTQGKKEFTALAQSLLNPQQPGLHNQAIMELGALQCLPQNPDCSVCPLVDHCLAYALHTVSDYPVKQNKTKTRDRYFHYFHIIYNGRTWLHRRSNKDIWKGLYEFPLIETKQAMDFSELQKSEAFHQLFQSIDQLNITVALPNVKHVLSHQVLYTTFYRVEIEQTNAALDHYINIACEEIGNYAVPRLVHIYLEKQI